jgi:hypothetical protein
MPRRFAIVIDELNLVGFDPRDRLATGAAVEREIQRLFRSAAPARLSGRRIERILAAPITLRSRSPAVELGSQLAVRIHRAVAPPQRGREKP